MSGATGHTPMLMKRGHFGWSIQWHVEPNGFESAMPDEATARRCLASADLLAACRALCTPPEGSNMPLGQHDHGPHYGPMCAAWDAARAAIAKAEGGQP